MDTEEAGRPSGPRITHGTRIVLEAGTPYSAISETARALDLPLGSKERFALEYALSEVLFNALRATTERRSATPVVAELVDDGEYLNVTVEDGGGGFDVGRLPYDFAAENDQINVNSGAFDQYRSRFEDRRFGLGLLTARTMVDGFALSFIGASGADATWQGPGSVQGTRVRFRVKRVKGPDDQRRLPRRPVTGSATTADGLRARVRDLSLGGARLIVMSNPVPKLDEVYEVHMVLEDEEPMAAHVPARIAWVKRMGHCYDVGADFLEFGNGTLARLRWMIEQIESSAQHEALGKIHVELLRPPAEEP